MLIALVVITDRPSHSRLVSKKQPRSIPLAGGSPIVERQSLPRVQSWSPPEGCNVAWPLPDTPMPVVDHVALPQLSLFPRPVTSPSTIFIYNFCDYDIWVLPILGEDVLPVEHVAKGARHSRPLAPTANNSGTSLKVSKIKDDFSRPVQIEYTAQDDGRVFFDLSLIDCLGRSAFQNDSLLRNNNTSACAGHEAGLQFGNSQSKSFQCGPATWCDDQAYFYEVGVGDTTYEATNNAELRKICVRR